MGEDYLNKPLSLVPSPAVDDPSKSRSSAASLGASVSPYLNYDARFLQQMQPEFILPQGASKQRGRFELAFSQIGSAAMVGAAIGGVGGVYNGLVSTTALKQTGKLMRTQMLNHVMKQGSGTANTFGTLAVMYSAFGVLLQFARGEDDDINTVVAASSTGLLYKSTAGLRKCALGGGIGLGISALYCLFQYTRSQSHSGNQYKFA